MMKTKKHNKHRNSPLRRLGEPISPSLFDPGENRSLSLSTRSSFKRFPDFGKEVKRAYEIHENCYDCRRLVKGCKGWKVTRKFMCSRVKWYKIVEVG